CLNRRAMALANLNRAREAGDAIRPALAKDPENAITQANQGWILLQQGNPLSALEHSREALRLNPRMEWARQNSVEAVAMLVRQGKQGDALKHFDGPLRLDPELEWGRQKVVQALTDRLRGRIALAFSLWWMLGCVVTVVKSGHPQLLAFLCVLVIWYGLYFPFLPAVTPALHLLVRCRRLGRLVLSRDQKRASSWVGACLLAAVGTFVVGMVTKAPNVFLGTLVLEFLVLPMGWTFACPSGWRRWLMAAYTAGLAAAGGAMVAVTATGS